VINHVFPPGEEGMHIEAAFCECIPVPDNDTYYHNEIKGPANDFIF
jgi:hypothetical protein